MIGSVECSPAGELVHPLDNVKQTVRLASGLRDDGTLDEVSRNRALFALAAFGERLRSFAPETVRAVATNTLRVARNAAHFLATAEAALGFPIEVISGLEEARLIYLGAAHSLPCDGQPRLVIDIGGGSTECIVGTDMQANALGSIPVGCVVLSTRHFAEGPVRRKTFDRAYYEARAAIAQVADSLRSKRWRYAVGTSGTAKALWQIAQAQWGVDGIDRESLAGIHAALIAAGDVESLELAGLRVDRRPVLAGGLAVMMAAFDELGIESMRYCGGALRHGVLYDLLGRREGHDTRAITIEQMLRRYRVDQHHVQRVRDTALGLFDQGARGAREVLAMRRRLLGWAAELAEVGRSISHEGFHKHSAYILGHADMPGFSQGEQNTLAHLALAQLGGLRKMQGLIDDDLGWVSVVALRIATILHRRRDDEDVPMPALFLQRRSLRIEMTKQWTRDFPLSHETLVGEAAAWTDAGVFASFEYRTI